MNPVEKWPVGLRFRPTDAELVGHHLRMKREGKTQTSLMIPELNIYKFEPWDLFSKYNELSDIPSDGEECFFFCPQQNKNPNGRRFASNRMTEHGYWKDTCKKRSVRDQDTGKEIGMKRIFVYYQGRQRKGCNNRKTDFVMHIYYLVSDVPASTSSGPMGFVLCRIIDRHRNKTSSAKQVAQETSTETYPNATMESENLSESLNFNASESCKSSIQQTQLDEEGRSGRDEDGGTVGCYDDPINVDMQYSPSNGIFMSDLLNGPGEINDIEVLWK